VIFPKQISPYDINSISQADGINFLTYGNKFLLYHNGSCIFEVITLSYLPPGNLSGHCSDSDGNFFPATSLPDLAAKIKDRYPEVVDWFLFNLKNISFPVDPSGGVATL
jgi:hypothetical protein